MPETFNHELIPIKGEEAKQLFDTRRPIVDLFVFFKCRYCEKHFYMLKEDYEKRCEYWEDGPHKSYIKPAVVDLTNIQEHGGMFYYDRETKEWQLLYTIIS